MQSSSSWNEVSRDVLTARQQKTPGGTSARWSRHHPNSFANRRRAKSFKLKRLVRDVNHSPSASSHVYPSRKYFDLYWHLKYSNQCYQTGNEQTGACVNRQMAQQNAGCTLPSVAQQPERAMHSILLFWFEIENKWPCSCLKYTESQNIILLWRNLFVRSVCRGRQRL